jgi:hypothetical protein
MKPKEFLKIKQDTEAMIEQLEIKLADAEELAYESPLPRKLRIAKSKDIVVNNIIWYKNTDGGGYHHPSWAIIEEVLIPGDLFKAFVGHDGHLHGLDGAYVESE